MQRVLALYCRRCHGQPRLAFMLWCYGKELLFTH